ncbi:MAG TPA: homoserine O-succinyltransferase [Longimicrobiales bacterium]|nr:homoserine O-succinyltransferase [Longimicrobiales bacterium]
MTAVVQARPRIHAGRVLDDGSGVVHLSAGSRSAVVAYRRSGDRAGPQVVVLGGVSAHRTVWDHDDSGRRGWWSDQVGPGRAVDTTRFGVISLDWVGGPDASAWTDGDPGRDRGVPSPGTARIQARALEAVLDHLGIRRVEAVVGASFGGMVALDFAAVAPDRLARLVVLCAAHEPDPATSAVRSIQRRIVRLGLERGDEAGALAIARALAVVGYRSPEEFASRFPGAATSGPGGVRVRVDDYLDHVGPKILDRFDAAAYLSLSEALDLHAVAPESIGTPAFLWCCLSDRTVPPRQMEELAGRLGGPSRLVRAPSLFGHDAFLKETGAVDAFLRSALRDRLPRWKEVRS